MYWTSIMCQAVLKCFHLLIHWLHWPCEVGTIIPFYRWKWGTGRVCNLPRLGFKPIARLQSPHCYSYAAFSHQAAGAFLNDGNAFRRERECSSKKGHFLHIVLRIHLYSRLSICLSSTSQPISSPLRTTQLSPSSHWFFSLSPLFLNFLNSFYSK